MRKYLVFDLEIAKSIPDGTADWKSLFPLGITCAAAALEGEPEPVIWQGSPQMDRAGCEAIVRQLEGWVAQGHTLLTWNGCSFDFHVLAIESGMLAECARLAADHIDLMLMFTFKQGYFLGLDKALKGAGIQGKLKQVTLKSGEILGGMDGARAPALWAQGEYEAVLAYLRDDVLLPLQLARKIEQTRKINWTNSKGGLSTANFDRLYSVRECFDFPQPDTSWMKNPPKREDFIRWMPGGKLPALAGA